MKKNQAERRAEVRGIIAEWEASGLSQAAFAKREGIVVNTLRYWIKRERLEQQLRGVEGESRLAEVTLAPGRERSSQPFRVVLGPLVVEIPRDTTTEEWKRLREGLA